MKILLATSKAIPSGGGIASYNQELVRLLGKDNEIHVLTDSDEHDVEGYVSTYSTFGHSNSDTSYCHRLVDRINSTSYDCIINSASAFVLVLAPFLKAPIISVSHFVKGTHAINAGFNPQYQGGIIALSEYGKKYLVDKFDITDSDKVKVIYNFVETINQIAEVKSNDATIKIVYPGGTSISKSLDVVQQVVYRLLSTDMSFEFYWLGGTHLPSANFSPLGLKDTRDLFPKDNRLKIMGLVSRHEAMRIMTKANVFLLPSRAEGCPMTLLEAMRGGCIPIISDARHGSLDIIEQSRAGIITPQGSSKAIFNTIRDIIINHSKYVGYYSASADYLRNNLSQESWGLQMKEVIDHAVVKEKKWIPFSDKLLKENSVKFSRLHKADLRKTMFKSGFFRIKIDISYLKNKLGLYK